MAKGIVIADEVVMNKIYQIRDHKVMFDRDLAELYGVKAIRLREQVNGIKNGSPTTLCSSLLTWK